MSAHAPLPPSSAHLWVACAGWWRLQQLVEPLDEDTEKQEEGNAAHWAVAQVLKGHQIDVGTVSPHGLLTLEMCEGADLMEEAIGPNKVGLHVEERISGIHPDNWGTPDAWVFDGFYLDVWDYKFGHRHVPAFENWQLLNYAAGILQHDPQEIWQTTHVRLHVVQPRDFHPNGPVRTWELMGSELRAYSERLRHAALANMNPLSQCLPHADCRDCKARYECPALQRAAIDHSERAFDPIPVRMEPTAIGRELDVLDRAMTFIEARRDGLEEQAKQLRGVPGWCVQQGKGRTRWARPVAEVLTLGQMMGISLDKPTVITPTQAIKAGVPQDVVNMYSETPAGETKLVRDDAREVFSQKGS